MILGLCMVLAGSGGARAACSIIVSPTSLAIVSFDGTYRSLGSGSMVAQVTDPGCLIVRTQAAEVGYFPYGAPLSGQAGPLPAWFNQYNFWDNGADLPYEPFVAQATVIWFSFDPFEAAASENTGWVTLTVFPT